MVVLIQIGTREVDYVIDVFPIIELIKTQLKQILEDETVLKYVYGGDNDFLWLKRCFFINIVNALDIGILFQYILTNGLLNRLLARIPIAQKKPWYHKYIGLRTASTNEISRLSWEREAGKEKFALQKWVELFYPDFVMDKDAQVADFRPREQDDPRYSQLLKYARDDVHVLYRIVLYVKGNVSYFERKTQLKSEQQPRLLFGLKHIQFLM